MVREALLDTLPSSSNECDDKTLEEKLHNQHDAVPAAVVVEVVARQYWVKKGNLHYEKMILKILSWENSSHKITYITCKSYLNLSFQTSMDCSQHLQNKPVSSKENLKNKLQIIHSNGNHWIAASNVKCDADYDVAIYDSI